MFVIEAVFLLTFQLFSEIIFLFKFFKCQKFNKLYYKLSYLIL